MRRTLANAGTAVLLSVAFLTNACSGISSAYNNTLGSTGPANGAPGFVTGFLGGAVADEPHAALVARDVLSAGGTAADAAVAAGFALAVALPSRAGLGGGGACLVFAAGSGTEAILFPPMAPAHPLPGGRPAAVPMLARGLYALHAKYGNRKFESLLAPAEQMARDGINVSRAFATDLAVVAGPLAADPGANAVFFPGGKPVAEGVLLRQPGLASTLSQLRSAGVGDLYQGVLAHLLSDAARDAGGGLDIDDMRGALPNWSAPILLPAGRDRVAFLPNDGGLATAAAFQVLQKDRAAVPAAGDRAISVAARFRQSGGDPKALLAAALPAASLPPLAASTSFLTLDRRGNAVACALTMNNLFGTGRVAPGTGILLAASPAWQTPPLLSVAIAGSADSSPDFRAAAGGSGQAAAPVAAALAMAQALADTGGTAHPLPTPAPEPGRGNVIQCNGHLPGDSSSCGMATDPRGAGLAIGSSP